MISYLLLCFLFLLCVAAFFQRVQALSQGLHHLRWRFGRLPKQWKHIGSFFFCSHLKHPSGRDAVMKISCFAFHILGWGLLLQPFLGHEAKELLPAFNVSDLLPKMASWNIYANINYYMRAHWITI